VQAGTHQRMKAKLPDANMKRMKREGKMGQRVVRTRECHKEKRKRHEIAA